MDILLFDADGNDRPLSMTEALQVVPTEHQLLWLDFDRAPVELDALVDHFGLEEEVKRGLVQPEGAPSLDRYVHHIAVRVHALAGRQRLASTTPLILIAGAGFVITRHERPIPFLDAFKAKIRADTRLGQLDATAFVAVLLIRHIEAYFGVFETLEGQVDQLDESVLRHPAQRQHLESLVQLRHQVSLLRRHLGAHRQVYAGLATPDFALYAGDEPEKMLTTLFSHFERAEVTMGTVRDLVVGSFDLYMTSTGQRTNDIMRVLTLVTVVLGLVAGVAGVMGMNFQIGFFQTGDVGFRTVLLGLALLMAFILFLFRRYRWL